MEIDKAEPGNSIEAEEVINESENEQKAEIDEKEKQMELVDDELIERMEMAFGEEMKEYVTKYKEIRAKGNIVEIENELGDKIREFVGKGR